MPRQFYLSREEALKSFIEHNLDAYVKIKQMQDNEGKLSLKVSADTDKLFDDFHDKLRSTLGDFFYLDYETK